MTILSGLVKQRKTTVWLYLTYKSFEQEEDIQQQSTGNQQQQTDISTLRPHKHGKKKQVQSKHSKLQL